MQRLAGQVIKISPTSKQYVNPMDLNLDYSDDENPLSLKVDFLLSFCDIVVGSKDGLQPVEKTVIDRCVRLVYRNYIENPAPENMPILEDLYNTLLAQEEKEAHFIATALEIYVTGSLNVFNHRTNVNINNRIVYLEGYRPDLYTALVASEKLYEHCAEIDAAARSRIDLIMPELAKSAGATEELKAKDQLAWVGLMNACKAQAEEIVKHELIYD